MILKGSQRGGAMQLARHLMSAEENEHVEVYELRGFASDKSLSSALQEVVAISKGTSCQQMVFSLSVNPPIGEAVSIADFEAAIDRAEQTLGLSEQPRAIVFHEKEERRHAHVVWSRIDTDQMKAINLPYYKSKLKDLSKDLFLEHGWHLPDGFKDGLLRDPMTFSREEWQQAKRAKQDPKQLKAMFKECWTTSDNRTSFQRALEEKGFYLANGRRGFVALDYKGEIYPISRWSGQKVKDVKAKLGDPKSLPSVEETKFLIGARMSHHLRRYIKDAETALSTKTASITLKKAQIKERHCAARQKLNEAQALRWADETATRANRFRNGVRGLWDWVSGKNKTIRKENEIEAWEAMKRDDKEREEQRQMQLSERRALQDDLQEEKRILAEEIAALKTDVAQYLDLSNDQASSDRGDDHQLRHDHDRAPQSNSLSTHRDRDDGMEM
ncbi:MAG: hypothetical protein Rhims3KO_36410 [Hyphomicrobiales bacterium]